MTDGTATGHAGRKCTPRSARTTSAPGPWSADRDRGGAPDRTVVHPPAAVDAGSHGDHRTVHALVVLEDPARLRSVLSMLPPASVGLPGEQGQNAPRPVFRPEPERHHPPVADPLLAEEEPEAPGREEPAIADPLQHTAVIRHR